MAKRKRILIAWTVKTGYINDDFIYSRMTLQIDYLLGRQKHRRRCQIKIPMPDYEGPIRPALLYRLYIYKFKKSIKVI